MGLNLREMFLSEVTSSVFDNSEVSLELFVTHLDSDQKDKTETIDKNVRAFEQALEKTQAFRQKFWDLAPATEQEISDSKNQQIGLAFCVLCLAYFIRNLSIRTLF